MTAQPQDDRRKSNVRDLQAAADGIAADVIAVRKLPVTNKQYLKHLKDNAAEMERREQLGDAA